MKYQREDLAYFPYQIEYALNNYEPHGLEVDSFNNILIGGLGGSGIAGKIVKNFFYDKASIPVEVVSDYFLPGFANEETLVILSSYSGNTEETLALADHAREKGCTILTITTGGTLEERASEFGYQNYHAEPGFQPRMALGYSLTYLFMILGELFNYPAADKLRILSNEFMDSEGYISNAEGFFNLFNQKLNNKIIAITDLFSYPAGLRFCQQLQENAKTEAFVHEVPEANHNVIESYYGDLNSTFFLLNSQYHERVSLRFDFLKDLLEKNGNKVVNIPIKEPSMEALLKTIFILDWIALLLADAKNINSSEIPNIKTLKEILAGKKN